MKTTTQITNSFHVSITGFLTTVQRLRLTVVLISLLLGFFAQTRAQSLSTFIPVGAEWAYLDDGSDLGDAWRALSFDDGAWSRGPAELGYGDGDEATVVRRGDNLGNVFVTTYFRRTFSVADPSTVTNLVAAFKYDHGIVGYLNGVEVFRSNMPTGMITGFTFASEPIEGTNERVFTTAPINPSLLKTNQNVLAVEVHQSQVSSNDLSFDLKLEAQVAVTGLPARISQQPTNQVTLDGGTASFNVMADGTPPLSFQWKRDGVALAGITVNALSIQNVQLTDAGSYSVVIANAFGAIESTAATLTVIGPPVSVSGRVSDPAGQPVDGVTLVVNGPTRQSVLSDPDGTYAFHGLRYGGAYTIAVGDTNLAATPADMYLNPLTNSAYVNFTVATPYQAWQQQFWGANTPQGMNDPDADADGDGKPNLIEFAMGSSPVQPDVDSGIVLQMVNANGVAHPVIHLKLSPLARDLGIGVEMKTNLADSAWIPLCERRCTPLGGKWSPSPGVFDGVQIMETPEGADVHVSPIPAGTPIGYFRWRAALPPRVSAPVRVPDIAPPRNAAPLLVGFNNFQRMPGYVKNLIDPSGNPLGYESDRDLARQFAQRVLKAGYDIIALAEVWTDEAKNWLEHDLKEQYPYYVKEVNPPRSTSIGFKGQDSGLMLFSKLPFKELPGSATSREDMIAQANGSPFTNVAQVRFGDHCWGIDSLSDKGAGMVEVHDPVVDRDYIVVFTHLNGPISETDGDREARTDQLTLIRNMVTERLGEPPFTNSVLVLGDFNINGDMLATDDRPEWTFHFGFGDGFWRQNFVDTWEAQSLQEFVPIAQRDRGRTCSPLNAGARYDYLLTHRGTNSTFCVQHMALALNLRWPMRNPETGVAPETPVAFGYAGTKDLSDHYGIIAYIHPNVVATNEGTSPAKAIRVGETPMDTPSNAVVTPDAISVPGEMRWFVIPRPGTYSLAIVSDGDFQFDVFSSLDLSQQAAASGSHRELEIGDAPYRVQALTYVCPFSSLFVRVKQKDPTGTGTYRLVVRRHHGANKEDAISLAPSAWAVQNSGVLSSLSPRCYEAWYRIATDPVDSGAAQTLWFELLPQRATQMIGCRIRLETSTGDLRWLWADAAPSPYGVRRDYILEHGGDDLFLRVEPISGSDPIQLRWSTDLTVVLPTNSVPLAQFGHNGVTPAAALVIDTPTDEVPTGIDPEDQVRLDWVLTADAGVRDCYRYFGDVVAIRSQLPMVEIADSIRRGQAAYIGCLFPTLRFLPNEFLEVRCEEDDDGPDSFLRGAVYHLPPESVYERSGANLQGCGEDGLYGLRLNRVHGLRWIQFGAP